ncbi:hypothetical protein TNCV_2949591 [Trichonephila clavipes]|nr:hypothetical protein TNCV_2949591 [Trichonephila clavipes]
MKEGLIASSYECPKCNEQMGLNERKSVVLDGFEWRCRKKATQKACSTITSLSIYGVSRSLTQRRDFPEFFKSSCYTLPSTWEGSTIRKMSGKKALTSDALQSPPSESSDALTDDSLDVELSENNLLDFCQILKTMIKRLNKIQAAAVHVHKI